MSNSIVSGFIDDLNKRYEQVHKGYEDNFWATKMALRGCSSEALSVAKTAYDNFLADASNLIAVRDHMKASDLTEEQKCVLAVMERTFKCYITEDPAAKELKEKINQLEAQLAEDRWKKLELGYTDPSDHQFKKLSSVALRSVMRVNDDEAVRKACYESMRTVGPFVAKQFIEIVKLRNKLARRLGYEDFYDYKVTVAEGFGKSRLFSILDELERESTPILKEARETLAKEKGESALEPHNMMYALAGDVNKAMDPYFPFEDAVDVWGRSFAALGINYRGATMRLDLCDREGKYSNGFCHWPQPAWRRPDGSWVPSQANFTSLATPSQVGSGKTALETLMHEGGHAAHMANVDQPSPLFSQERAPTSVAYAENQSMFLDSMTGDAEWLGRYACSREGEVIPWSLLQTHIESTHPYEVFQLRSMLAVAYFEKELYEMKEEDLTEQALLDLADKVEVSIQGGLTPRPLLSVPHILSDESSAYYHGYALAEMAVHQTREHFLSKYGRLADNEQIGKDLTEIYWRPGNGAMFLELVEMMTGRPLAATSWIHQLKKPLAELLEEERAKYKEAVKVGPKYPPGADINLDMNVILVHGDEVIASSKDDGGFQGACKKFKDWVRANYFKTDSK